ncbi:hypothetical protein SAMN05421505_102249 [Sinosporangium album]|uniref:Uncharacterized protein n=1 Tax=Sinosporangium album TaxID=504805 RepID=A0A1G7SEF2_9ACTN|nr:hypothetical protein SAMN05421505_102249 [Sinosporangium album]
MWGRAKAEDPARWGWKKRPTASPTPCTGARRRPSATPRAAPRRPRCSTPSASATRPASTTSGSLSCPEVAATKRMPALFSSAASRRLSRPPVSDSRTGWPRHPATARAQHRQPVPLRLIGPGQQRPIPRRRPLLPRRHSRPTPETPARSPPAPPRTPPPAPAPLPASPRPPDERATRPPANRSTRHMTPTPEVWTTGAPSMADTLTLPMPPFAFTGSAARRHSCCPQAQSRRCHHLRTRHAHGPVAAKPWPRI